MRNPGLEEAQAGIKIVGGNTNKPQICRWHHPMAESEEELKRLLMKMEKESERLA